MSSAAAAAAYGPRQSHAKSVLAGSSSGGGGGAAGADAAAHNTSLDPAALISALWATHPLGITDDAAFMRTRLRTRITPQASPPSILTRRFQASLQWLSDVHNRTALVRALAAALQVRQSRHPDATSAAASTSTGNSGTSSSASSTPDEAPDVDVDMDALLRVWLALVYAERGANWQRQQCQSDMLIDTARAILRSRLLHTCAAALAAACREDSSDPSSPTSSAATPRCEQQQQSEQPRPQQQEPRQPPDEAGGSSAATAGPNGSDASASPALSSPLEELSGASHCSAHPAGRVRIRGASVPEFLISAAWVLLDVPCAIAQQLLSFYDEDEDDQDCENVRQYIIELVTTLRDSNILEIAAMALLKAMQDTPAAAEAQVVTAEGTAAATVKDMTAKGTAAAATAQVVTVDVVAAELLQAEETSGSGQGAQQPGAAARLSESWLVQQGLTLMARTVINLLKMKDNLGYDFLDDADCDLEAAMSGPALNFAVLGRGVAAMVAADGGTTYGLPYERLPHVPAAHRDESLACLTFFLYEAGVLRPPLRFENLMKVQLRVGRISLAALGTWREQQQDQQQPGAGEREKQSHASPSATHGHERARRAGRHCGEGGNVDAHIRRYATAASITTGVKPMECATTALVGSRRLLQRSSSGKPGFRGRATAETWRLGIDLVSYVGTAADHLTHNAPGDFSCLLWPDECKLVDGALPARPNTDMALALSSGLLPCLERLVRRAAAAPRSHSFLGGREGDLLNELMFDADEDYPLIQLLSYGDPGQVAALVASMGKAARCRRTALVRACSAAVQNPAEGLKRVFMGQQAAPSGGGGGGAGSAGAGGNTAGGEDRLLILESGIFTDMFSPSAEDGILLMDALTLLADTCAAAGVAAGAARGGSHAVAVGGGQGDAGNPDANIGAPPPALHQLAAVVSLVAQQWLPDLVGPMPWAVRHTETSGLVADMLELSYLRHLELHLDWIQLLAIVPEEGKAGRARQEGAAASAGAAATGSEGAAAAPATAAAADSVSWRRRALQRLGALPLLGLELRLMADVRWRRRLGFQELRAAVDGPRLAMLADCLCRVAALMPGDVRQAAVDRQPNRQPAAGAAPATEAGRTAYCLAKGAYMHAQKERMDAVGRAAGLESCVAALLNCGDWESAATYLMHNNVFDAVRAHGFSAANMDRGAAPLSYWPPALVRSLGRELRRLGRGPAAAAVQELASALEGLAKESLAGAERRLAAVAAPEAPPEIMAAAAALLPPDVVRRVLPLRTCSYPGCTNLTGDSEAGLRLLGCGRCGGAVSYCSRECQAAHWKAGHKAECGARAPTQAGPSAEPPPQPAAPLQQQQL